jgi:ATP-dependent DNA helicase PIF1
VDVNDLNNLLLCQLPADEMEFRSIDSASTEDELTYSEEYLNLLDISGVPPYRLKLKVGAPIMLLRNINHMLGLCNGTRMQVTHLSQHIIGGMSHVLWFLLTFYR